MNAKSQTPQGAVQLALEAQLFGKFTTRESEVVVGVTTTVIVNNNPERIGMVIVNSAGVPVTISLKRDVALYKGLILSQQGDTLSTNYIEDAQFPTHELSAIADGTPSELYIIEFIRDSL